MDYKEEIAFLKKVEKKDNPQNNRHLLDETEIQLLREKYNKVPDDFWDYLKCVGTGSFRECQFSIYPQLTTPNDWDFIGELDFDNDIVFFGDNFSGDFSGFDLNGDGTVIEYWHESREIYKTGKVFSTYIREQMLMDEFGNDMREG